MIFQDNCTLLSCPTTAEWLWCVVLVWEQCFVTVSWQSSMVVMSTTVSHTVLGTFLGVDTGTLLHVFTGTDSQMGGETFLGECAAWTTGTGWTGAAWTGAG